MQIKEPAPAKLNLALHVRGKLPDGRHRIETVFAFCTEGDEVAATTVRRAEPLGQRTLCERSWRTPRIISHFVPRPRFVSALGIFEGAELILTKNLPVASGIGGGSADAAAALRLLTRLLGYGSGTCDGDRPTLGADVPGLSLSMTGRGDGAGTKFSSSTLGVSGTPVLLVNPRVELSTADVFSRWTGGDKGPLEDWRTGVTISREAAVEHGAADPHNSRMAVGSTGRELCPHVRQRRDLLRFVRKRRGAGRGRDCSSSGMVAAGDLSALTALQ